MRKLMKKSVFTLAIVMVISLSLMVTSLASNFEHLAQDLQDLGLFQGTNEGFELDRQPTRVESLVMLLRLLGLEEEALASDYAHPFTDVPAWADRHVAFAFERELTQGISPTQFGSTNFASAQMYVTFVLRALGYNDPNDFTFANAVAFGTEKGIIDSFIAGGTFYRDDMVAVSFLALAAEPNDSEYDRLLEQLVSEGAVSAAAAAPVLNFFEIFDELSLVGAELYNATAISMSMGIDITMDVMGETVEMSMTMDIDSIVDDTDILLAMVMNISADGEEVEMNMYMTGGYMFMETGGVRVRADAGLDEMMDLMAMLEMDDMDYPMYIYTSLTRTTQDEYIVFGGTLADNFMDIVMGMTAGMMDSMGMGFDELDLDGMDFYIPSFQYFVTADGALRRMVMPMTMTMDMGVLGSMTISMNMDITINAVGDDVVVNLPDNLDEFEIVDASQINFGF